MSLAHRELTRALETQRQLEQLAEQAERFESIAPVNIFAIQEAARRMTTAKALTASHMHMKAAKHMKAIQEAAKHMKAIQEAAKHMTTAKALTASLHANAIQETARRMTTALAIKNMVLHFEVPKISLNMDCFFPDNINFTEIHNKLINDFQKLSNNWVIPNLDINMPTLRIGIPSINLSEPTTDIEGNNKNPNTTDNDTDNSDQEIELDINILLYQNFLPFEITRLRQELHQDSRVILMVTLSTLGLYSVLLDFIEMSDGVWFSILSILGTWLYQWNGKKR